MVRGASITSVGAFTNQGNVFGALGKMATYRGDQVQATIGLGWAVIDQGSTVLASPCAAGPQSTLTLSARYPVGPRASMIAETWYIRVGAEQVARSTLPTIFWWS